MHEVADVVLQLGYDHLWNRLVAKSALKLDHISGGRAVLGLGGAWQTLEHQIEFGEHASQRLDWLDEATGVMRGLLDDLSAVSPRRLVDAITGVTLGDQNLARHSEVEEV